MFRNTRIYIGISLSDAASMSLLEAMVCGAFPIQTNTSCADEWIVNGKSGFIVSPDDHEGLVKAIRTALENDDLVDEAAQINYEVARNRLDRSVISEISRNFYNFVDSR
ncbi:MAG: glycosyltransferase family 1 protein [Actinobacteria bacterium]|nr:glycosyltransferase family 1 protein [Actinomycetota bacterium]